MAFSIDTFGPYPIDLSSTKANCNLFWKQVNKVVGSSYGLYIFAERRATGELFPWYVGRTLNRFETRINSHLRSRKIIGQINKISKNDPELVLFFIAFVSPQRGATVKSTMSRTKWTKFLEIALIGNCIVINPKLVNNKETHLFRKVEVPGYIDDPATRDEDANALALMLRSRP